MKHIRNYQKSIGKFIPANGFLKSQEKICEPKALGLLSNVCDFQKRKPYPMGLDLKIYSLFFVISISGVSQSFLPCPF
jgi:hypothetical protein